MTRGVVYLDNAATTAVDPRVIAAMQECLGADGAFANPSSVSHGPGREAGARVERARDEVAALVNAAPDQVIFTSGATEANNLALLGVARFHASQPRHLVTSRTEHPAVLDACRQLEREGCAVTYLQPGPGGIVEPAQVDAALRPETLLVSLMHVNNEIGVIQDVRAVGQLCRARGVLFHVDAAQSAGKVPLDMQADGIDLLALTAHKLHGPKGIGALCVRREPRVGLVPLQFGGGQQRGLRSGTLPTHQVVGMGAAYAIARETMADDMARIAALRTQSLAGARQIAGRGAERRPRPASSGHPQRHGRRRRRRDAAAGAGRSRRFLGLGLREPQCTALVRAARSGSHRPPGPKFTAAEPGALYHGRRHRSCRGTYPPRGAQAQGG